METQDVITNTKWAVDMSHTDIEFKAKHLMIANVKGSFSEFGANIFTNGDDFTSCEINFWINTTSVKTGDAKRDEHLKGPDFFDVEKHKKMIFIGGSFIKTDKVGSFELYGELTIKGVTKKIKLSVAFGGTAKDPYGNEKAGFNITGILNRSDWGLNWNTPLDSGGLMVSDQITINCDLELTKEKDH